MRFNVMNSKGEYFTARGTWSPNPSRAWELSPAKALAVARHESAAAIAVQPFVEEIITERAA